MLRLVYEIRLITDMNRVTGHCSYECEGLEDFTVGQCRAKHEGFLWHDIKPETTAQRKPLRVIMAGPIKPGGGGV